MRDGSINTTLLPGHKKSSSSMRRESFLGEKEKARKEAEALYTP